jgi:hypothetical protein
VEEMLWEYAAAVTLRAKIQNREPDANDFIAPLAFFGFIYRVSSV